MPKLICMTPVRNEDWLLPAFLEVTSLWADYIIIVDQMSSDRTKEILLKFPKVILVENNNSEYNESYRQTLLINKAREIEGDKILLGLDADEIFSANFKESKDWYSIINSVPGDVFWFKWAEIRPDQRTYWEAKDTYYPWAFHDDNVEPHGNYARNMHSMRIPYPIHEKQMFYVNDFKVLHLAYLNVERTDAKRRFYKTTDFELNKRTPISLSRSYAQTKKESIIKDLDSCYIYNKAEHGFDLFDLIDLKSKKYWFDEVVINKISKLEIINLKKVDLWDSDFLKTNNIKDPRCIKDKLIHKYLKKTQLYNNALIVKIIDLLLKRFYTFK